VQSARESAIAKSLRLAIMAIMAAPLWGDGSEGASAATPKIAAGDIVLSHSLGHVNLELDCGEDSIPRVHRTIRRA
jgi:hypothetical protein